MNENQISLEPINYVIAQHCYKHGIPLLFFMRVASNTQPVPCHAPEDVIRKKGETYSQWLDRALNGIH